MQIPTPDLKAIGAALVVALVVLVGRWVKPFIPEKNLKQGFAFFLIGIGTWVILKP